MKSQIEVVENKSKGIKYPKDFLNLETAKKVQKFHSSFIQYKETPLAQLKNLSHLLGVKNILLKDESFRFGLNAFKVLGGSYAIGNYIAGKLGKDIEDLPYTKLISKEVKETLGEVTFITATDGNHGRGVAWAANQLGQKSIVYMPKGSSKERLENIREFGATAEIKDLNYDECVRLASKEAEEHGYIMVQDTAWEGYEDIPKWIIQGYITLVYEAYQEMQKNDIKPTHIFLQAGVGSFAAAVTGFFASIYQQEPPVITVVEPDKADCNFKTAKANDGKRHFVTDDMNTIMNGLACGEPCTVAWDILSAYTDYFMSVSDNIAAHGMRVLGNPLGDDTRVISGESGAVTTGVLSKIMMEDNFKDIKKKLKLDENSVVLLISTEGDTDINQYRSIVWDGAYQSNPST